MHLIYSIAISTVLIYIVSYAQIAFVNLANPESTIYRLTLPGVSHPIVPLDAANIP